MLIEIEVVDRKDANFNQVRIGGTIVLVKATDLEAAQLTLPDLAPDQATELADGTAPPPPPPNSGAANDLPPGAEIRKSRGHSQKG